MIVIIDDSNLIVPPPKLRLEGIEENAKNMHITEQSNPAKGE